MPFTRLYVESTETLIGQASKKRFLILTLTCHNSLFRCLKNNWKEDNFYFKPIDICVQITSQLARVFAK